ncbi:restriction endonuclease subunit S [Sedimenticola hydrogenitrophicus]|uniref:restriction endonuclease subunit S n=1 Tax=Sedimenticola hydrogenitrophicus TaxID=2967975 RepID=UPI0023B030A1|nr:restriction endonuclease subunit S [Sedimenticola hydrogenitrophicus]
MDSVCEFIVDTKHKTPKFTDEGYPCIRTPNIGRGYFILENAKYVSEESYKEWVERAVPSEGDLIFAREAPVGNVAIIPKGLKVCHGQRTVLIRPDKTKVDSHYLMYLMLGDELQNRMYSMASGATVPHLNMSDIRALELPELPPLKKQKELAGVLSVYDKLIENNNRRIAILEEMAQSLYREWFVKFRFPGHDQSAVEPIGNAESDPEGASARDGVSQNAKFIDSSLGKIPEGWEVKKLGDVASINPESITKQNAPDRINYIDIKSVGTGTIDEIKPMPFSGAPSRARRIVRDGDIIWATVRPNRKQYSYMAKPEENTVVSTGFAVIRAETVPKSYLMQVTSTDGFVSYLVNHATGAAYPAVNSKDFENAGILLPPHAMLDMFDGMCSAVLEQCELLKRKNRNLAGQRDMLLPKLISGTVLL